MQKGLLFGVIIFTGILILFIGPGCANIIPPTGGARDSIPPILIKANPPDSSVNFSAKAITLQFDEYLADLQNIQNNLIFTPTFQNNPNIEVRAKTLTVKFRDTLEKNTTYVLNFGNAIADANETNVLRGFTYTFSTGPVLDSLELSGRVILAETGNTDTTLVAVLHRNLTDSAVYNNRPIYAVKLDGSGHFKFKNLPADTFALYVLGDAGITRRYQTKNQLFGFTDAPVVAGSRDSLVLYAYREETKIIPVISPPFRPGSGDRRLRFNLPATNQQDLLDDYLISFPVPLKSLDTTKMHLSADSIFTPANFSVTLDTTKKNLRLVTQWKQDTRYNLVLERDFAADTSGKQLLKTDTLFFTTKKTTEYGNVLMRFRNLDLTKNPVLQFVQNNLVILSVPLKSSNFTRALFLPGEYSLRILFDKNGNGKWDPGQFYKTRKQPEIVHPIRQPITIKADWDNEFDIDL